MRPVGAACNRQHLANHPIQSLFEHLGQPRPFQGIFESRFEGIDIHRQAPKNTALLTYEGTGHGVYTRSDCTRAAADNYLLALKTPGQSCPEARSRSSASADGLPGAA